MPDVSIMITARDNFSSAITRMQQAVRPFGTSLNGLQQTLDHLNSNRLRLQVDMTDASRALKDAQKEYKELTRAAEDAQRAMDDASTPEEQTAAANRLAEANNAVSQSRTRLSAAQEDYNQLRNNLNLVSREAQRTQRSLENLTRTQQDQSRNGNGNGGDGGGPDPAPPRNRWDQFQRGVRQLAQAGAIQLFGDAASEIANTFVASAGGQTAGTLFSSTLGGAASGAAIGTAIAPGVGTAVGALAGGAVGLLQGGSKIYEAKDDAFKTYVQGATEDALSRQGEALSNGSAIAAQRETNQLAFSTLFGDADVAKGFLEELKTMANVTPFEYSDLTGMSRTLKTFGYDRDHILPTLSIVGDAGAALGMSAEDMNWVATSLGRMNSSGKTTLEYINPLQERGIDAVGAIAKALDLSKGDVYDLISDGAIAGEDAARCILRAMAESFSGAMSEQSQTMSGLQSTLEDANAELNNAMGEGYNEARKEGLQSEIDFLSGETGQQMQDAYKQIGEWKAALENSKEEMNRDILSAVMNGDPLKVDYGDSQEDIEASVAEMQQQYADAVSKGGEEGGAAAGEVLARAQTLAISAYNASEGAQTALESELALAGRIRDDTASNSAFWDAGYRKGEELSKGLAARLMQIDASEYSMGVTGTGTSRVVNNSYLTGGSSHAYGMGRVPYDEFPALLHEGERVLTANQARQQDSGQAAGAPITITGNNFHVREEADIGKVAAALYERVRIAQATRMP